MGYELLFPICIVREDLIAGGNRRSMLPTTARIPAPIREPAAIFPRSSLLGMTCRESPGFFWFIGFRVEWKRAGETAFKILYFAKNFKSVSHVKARGQKAKNSLDLLLRRPGITFCCCVYRHEDSIQ